jgi:hypothetical protein
MTAEHGERFENHEARQHSKKPYSTPLLTVLGGVEVLTKNKGLLLTDTLISGSVVP